MAPPFTMPAAWPVTRLVTQPGARPVVRPCGPARAHQPWPGRAVAPLVTAGLLGVLTLSALPSLAAPRIVTLSPSLTEAVCALGHCAELVGTDRHSTWPEADVARLPRVGGLQDAHIESIVALRPDLVLLGPRSRAADRLRDLGLSVQVFDARTHADLRRMLLALGDALQARQRAEALVRRIDLDLQAAAQRVPAAWRGRSVYVEVGVTGPIAASAQSFIGETLTALGLVNVIGAEQGLFPKVNPETVVRRNPDLIVAPQATALLATERPGWAHVSAVRQRRVCALDVQRMDLLSRPGPRLGEAAHMLVDCLLTLPQPTR